MKKVSINLVTWNGARYVIDCLESIFGQTLTDYGVLIIDNNSTDDTVDIIMEKYPHLKVVQHRENFGFSKAHNQAIHWSKSEYVVVLNQDVVLEPDFLEKMVGVMDSNDRIGSATGKILRLQDNSKTKYIDSVGLQVYKNHKFAEVGAGEQDESQYDAVEEVFGVSGACPMYRRDALESVKMDNQFFDESFGMVYKEDVDLAYRLRYKGWLSYKVPMAGAYHDRTTGVSTKEKNKSIIKSRRLRSRFVNFQSYRNHLYVVAKNLPAFNFKYFWPVFWYELFKFLYVLVFETRNVKAMSQVIKNRKMLKEKRNEILGGKVIQLSDLDKWYK